MKIYGLGRTRHGDKGKISGLHLNPYTMCIHTLVGGGMVNNASIGNRIGR